MYIYYRQCHRTFKPAAIFPIEVELGINLEEASRRYLDAYTDEPSEPAADDPSDPVASNGGQSSSSQIPPAADVDDLLLDLGLTDSGSAAQPAPPPLQTGGLEQ